MKKTRTLRPLSLSRETIKLLAVDRKIAGAGDDTTDIVTYLGCTTIGVIATLIRHCMDAS